MLFDFVRWIRRRGHGNPYRRPRKLALQFEALEERTLLSTSLPLNPLSWTNMYPAGGDTVTPTTLFSGTAGPISGEITAIAPNPNTQGDLLIGTGGAGIWHTLDNGQTWTSLTDQAPPGTGVIGSLTRDPDNPNIIYAGTGDPNYMSDSVSGKGIMKSTDGGQTWTLLGSQLFTGYSIAKIVVDWQDSQTLFAAVTNSGAMAASGNAGIWRSSDGGQTWTNITISTLAGTLDFTDVIVDPQSENLIFAVGVPSGDPANGVYFSTNPKSAAPTSALVNILPSGVADGRISLASGWRGVYTRDWATISDPAGHLLMLGRTTNGSPNWVDVTPTLTNSNGKNNPGLSFSNYLNNPYSILPNGSGNYVNAIGVDPNNTDYFTVAGGFNDFFDAGTKQFYEDDVVQNYYTQFLNIPSLNWAPINDLGQTIIVNGKPVLNTDATSVGSFSHALVYDAFGDLYDATDTGLWMFQGGTFLDAKGNPQTQGLWTNLNGNLPIAQFTNVSLVPGTNNTIIGGARATGSDTFQDGIGWTQGFSFVSGSGSTGRTLIDPTNPQDVYQVQTGTLDHANEIYFSRSTDGGQTYFPESQGLGISDNRDASFLPLVLNVPNDPSLGPTRLLLGTDRVYVNNTPEGPNVTWTVQNNLVFPGQTIQSIAAAASDENTIYMGVGNQLFRTTDNGLTVTNVAPSGVAVSTEFTSLLVDPSNAQIVYAVSPSAGNGRVWRSIDGGKDWTEISSNIPLATDAWSINLIPPANNIPDGILLLGTDAGVYASLNLGASWLLVGTGLPNVQIRDVEYDLTQNTLAVATYGRGVWEIQLEGSNQPPTITAPTALTANEDTPLPFTAPNVVSIADLAVGANTVQVSLSVTKGTLTLGSTAGLVFGPGSTGKNDLVSTFTGTLKAINTALAGLVYTPTPGFIGTDTLTITASDLGHTGGILSIVNTSTPTVVALTVNPINFSFEADPDSTTAGTALTAGGASINVDVLDSLGNAVPTTVVQVTISANGPGQLNGGTVTVAAVNGVASFTGLTLDKAGNYTLTASATNVPAVNTGVFVVSAGAASTLAFATNPATFTANATAGTPLPTLQVGVYDQFGNLEAGAGATVTLTAAGPGPLTGTTSNSAVGGLATFPGPKQIPLDFNKAGSYTLTAATVGLMSVTTPAFTVSPAPAATLVFTANPSTTTAGTALPTIQVSVVDTFGNLVTTSIPITIAANGPGALSGGNVTVNTVNGAANFSGLILNTAGNYTLTASDSNSPGLQSAGSISFLITPAAGVALAFAPGPGSTVVAGTLPTLKVNVVDPFGNVDTSSKAPITITATGPGSLSGTVTATAVAGTATFSMLTLAKVGTYTLTAASAGLTPVTSASFAVAPAAADHLAFVSSPGNASTSQPLATFTVELLDASGNLVATGGTAITITAATAAGPVAFSAGTPMVNTVGGIATFSGLALGAPGTYTLTASSPSLKSGASASFTVVQFAATSLAFVGTVPSATAGVALPTLQVNVLDQSGNLFTNQNVQVSLAATGPGTLGGTLTATSANGVATFTGLTLQTAGSYTLTASATGLTSGTSNTFSVNGAADNHLSFAKAPVNSAAGTLPSVQVDVLDALGNIANLSAAQVTVTATGPGALGGTTTVPVVNGVAIFSNLSLPKAGSYTLSATAGSLPKLTSASFTISAGAASGLAFAPISPATVTAGKPLPTFTVDVVDSFGNLVPSGSAQVTIAPGAVTGITGTTTATAVNGVASFSGIGLLTSGTYPLTAAATGLAPATSANLTVNPAAATQLVFEPFMTTIAAGQALQGLKVDLVDAFGNVATGSSAQVTITANGPGPLSASGFTQPALNGVATFFFLSFTTPGSYNLTASAPQLNPATSVPLTVIAGAPAQLVWLVVPSGGTANQTLPNLSVEVFDAFGNLASTSATLVTIAPSSPGTLSGSTSAPIVNGIATFPGLAFTKAGTYTLSATLAGQASVTTAPFTIAVGTSSSGTTDKGTHAVIAGVRFLAVPSKGTAGKVLTTIRVELVDSSGRQVKAHARVTLHLTHGRIKGTVVVTTNASGIATFSGLSIAASGKYTLVATATGVKATATHGLTIAAVVRAGGSFSSA